MIKINLASRKQSMAAAGVGGGTTKILANKMSLDMDSFRDLPIRKFILPVVVCALASYTVDGQKKKVMDELEGRVAKLAAEKPKLEAEANKLKVYEDFKKKLEADELTIRTKTETIQKLIVGRGQTIKMLVTLASAAPKDAWLSNFQIKEPDVILKGYAVGFGQISDYMKSLNESAYFADLTLKSSEKAKDDTGNDVVSFELNAKRR